MIVVLMGVAGSGKTTIGRALAARLGCGFLDGDDFHPAANVAKMAEGVPLTDEDRRPWLERLNTRLRERQARGESVVLACSALKEGYRAHLLRGLADCELAFLRGSMELIRGRLETRKHRYMPASLLASQFALLEVPAQAIDVDIRESAARCVEVILDALPQDSLPGSPPPSSR